jgi:1-acyl-sn-glycerol-3-phosphate acyltransferase
MSRGQSSPPLSQVSPLQLAVFQRYHERSLVRQFNAVRLARSPRPDLTAIRQRPLIVYLNRASWWDPLVCLQLASQQMPRRRHYAPIESEALGSDAFFRRLGFFGIDPHNARDARRFLEISGQVLEQPEATLWIAAAGSLSDPRERPLRPQPALGHLASRLRHGVLLPLAIEYPFWTGRCPEALLRFGEELAVEDAGMRAHDWNTVLAAHLEEAQDALAAAALSRDPTHFEVLRGGGELAAGAGGIQQTWRRVREALRGRRLSSEPGDPQKSS